MKGVAKSFQGDFNTFFFFLNQKIAASTHCNRTSVASCYCPCKMKLLNLGTTLQWRLDNQIFRHQRGHFSLLDEDHTCNKYSRIVWRGGEKVKQNKQLQPYTDKTRDIQTIAISEKADNIFQSLYISTLHMVILVFPRHMCSIS